jgi:hypothetical protein
MSLCNTLTGTSRTLFRWWPTSVSTMGGDPPEASLSYRAQGEGRARDRLCEGELAEEPHDALGGCHRWSTGSNQRVGVYIRVRLTGSLRGRATKVRVSSCRGKGEITAGICTIASALTGELTRSSGTRKLTSSFQADQPSVSISFSCN